MQTLAGLLLGLTVLPQSVRVAAAAAGARYYFKLRPIELAPGAASAAPTPEPGGGPGDGDGAAKGASTGSDAALKLAQDDLLEALKKRPEVVLELEGVAADAPPASIADAIKRRSLKGYEVTLRILKLERVVRPPPAGRKFRLLEQSVKLSLVGTLYPGEPTLALGGDGESTVQIEVGAQISERQERDVLNDAMQDAVGQAVAQALRKLQIGPMKPPKDPPRRRK